MSRFVGLSTAFSQRLRDGRSATRWLACMLCLGGLGIFSSPLAAAVGPDEASWGYSLAHEMMSPFCPGVTISACTSPQAAELRQWILLQESAGATREEVVSILEQRYGEAIRSTPEAEGWGLAAWLLPAGALAIGAILVTVVLRRLVARPARGEDESAPPPVPEALLSPEDEELFRRVDRELAARDR